MKKKNYPLSLQNQVVRKKILLYVMIEKLADLIERKEDNEEVDASITQKPKSVKKTSIQDN